MSVTTAYRCSGKLNGEFLATTGLQDRTAFALDRTALAKATQYRVFDPPFYKVRVGDFINWYDAEKLQKLAIQKGFREAWVIRTKVNLMRARKQLDAELNSNGAANHAYG